MKAFGKIFTLLFIFAFLVNVSVMAADKGNFSTAPATAPDGKKWRIGYYEGGEYIDYQTTLTATAKGLMELGWIEKAEIPPQEGEQTKTLWNWLVADAKSNYIEFVQDAYYSANWNDEVRKKMPEEIISRLNQKKDIDLMIAMGTWAGQDLANDKHKTPTIVLSTSDPLKAGIIKSNEDSGFDHIHARVDPLRYRRQVQLFHDIFNFKKLGIAYENTETGRTYGAIADVEEVAKERGFEIVSCYTQSDVPDKKIAEETVKKCIHELGEKKVDAVYVTLQGGVNENSISELVTILNSYKIPSFSQAGSKEVSRGILMSLSLAGFKYNGIFHAETIAKIFNGAKPRQLDQFFGSPPKLAINLKTADIIGYNPPMEMLGLVDEPFNEIEKPEKK
jgi:ABC-type uncharacterized transport system substrate-binding protein